MKKLFIILLCLLTLSILSAGGIVERVSNEGLHGISSMVNDLYSLEKNSLFTQEEKDENIERILSGVSLKTIIREHNAKLEAERLETPFFRTNFAYKGFVSAVSIAPTFSTLTISEKVKEEDLKGFLEMLNASYGNLEGVTVTVEKGQVKISYSEYDEDILLSAYRLLERDLMAYIDKHEELASLSASVEEEETEDISSVSVVKENFSYLNISGSVEAYLDNALFSFADGVSESEVKKLFEYVKKNGAVLFTDYAFDKNEVVFVYSAEDITEVEKEVKLFKELLIKYEDEKAEKSEKGKVNLDFGLSFGARVGYNISSKKASIYPDFNAKLSLSWYYLYASAGVEGFALKESEKLHFVGAVKAQAGAIIKADFCSTYIFGGARYVFSTQYTGAVTGFVYEFGVGANIPFNSNLFLNLECDFMPKNGFECVAIVALGYKF